MFPINTLSILEFRGQDAGQFLHNQLSADILGIESGSSGFACCCNPAGRVIALLLVCPLDDSYYTICSAELAEELGKWLGRFIFRDKVTVHQREDLQVFVGDTNQMDGAVCEIRSPAGLNYILSIRPEAQTAGEGDEQEHFKAIELSKGVSWLGTSSSGQYLPQMLGFESIGALSFNKGCYPGQEIIARTRYLGKLKRRPVLVNITRDQVAGIGEKVELLLGENSYSAVVVDQAVNSDKGQALFLVARMGADTRPEKIRIKGQESKILEQGFQLA